MNWITLGFELFGILFVMYYADKYFGLKNFLDLICTNDYSDWQWPLKQQKLSSRVESFINKNPKRVYRLAYAGFGLISLLILRYLLIVIQQLLKITGISI